MDLFVYSFIIIYTVHSCTCHFANDDSLLMRRLVPVNSKTKIKTRKSKEEGGTGSVELSINEE